MPSTNFLNPSSFAMSLDRQTYSGAEFTIQSASIPDISSEGAILSFKSVNTAMAAGHHYHHHQRCIGRLNQLKNIWGERLLQV